jgi:hypothetical protein
MIRLGRRRQVDAYCEKNLGLIYVFSGIAWQDRPYNTPVDCSNVHRCDKIQGLALRALTTGSKISSS